MSSASSSVRSMTSSNAARSSSARSRGADRAHSSCAATAASSARPPSAIDPSATLVNTAPVAGSCTSKRALLDASCHFPPMNNCVGTDARTDFCVTAMIQT